LLVAVRRVIDGVQSNVRWRGGVLKEAMNWSRNTSLRHLRDLMEMAFSKRDSVG
jgi:hypothetical protein